MSNWGILDDNSVSANDVEYVGMSANDGMAADEDVSVRAPRRPVRRASSASIPAYSRAASIPAYSRAAPMKPGKDNLYHLPMATGDSVAMNDEAIQNMRSGGVHDIGGRAGMRVKPGTYVTYGPGSGPSGHPSSGMGGNEALGTFDVGGLIGDIMEGVSDVTTAIGGVVIGARGQRLENELAVEEMRLADEAAREARTYAERENARAHQATMADIRRGREELAELQRQEEERAQYDTSTLPGNGAGAGAGAAGVSPVVWVLLAVVGIGGVGALVWALTKDKDEEK